MSRIVVDPITRIEGHLRIEAQVDGGKVRDAWSSTTMWRGIEEIIAGRDPRDAWFFAQRICGVCTTVHALASVRAVEDALGMEPPLHARLIRELIAAAQYVHDHVVHFYHLHALDWVDVTSALKGDPAKTSAVAMSLSNYPRSSATVFAGVKERLAAFVQRGRLGPFANAYWGHPAYQLSPEVNLLAVSHYLDALDFQRDFARVQAILGGKNPHPQTYVVGGTALPVDPKGEYALNDNGMEDIRQLLTKGLNFVQQAYIPDLVAIAKAYPEWTTIGGGLTNYMAFGDFTETPFKQGHPAAGGVLPGGLVRNRNLAAVQDVDPSKIAEYIKHSWFRYDGGEDKALRPFEGETHAHYTGPKPPFEYLDVNGKYTWLKAPRYDELAVEVGPLARMIVGYARGNTQIKASVDGALKELGAPVTALYSTLGRTLSRGLETEILAKHSLVLLDRLQANIRSGDLNTHDNRLWDPKTWPAHAQGVGFHEAPRGALSHWIVIEDQKVKNYQAVVPSTWNGSPRDAKGQRGAYEAALIGTPVAKPAQPLEILRTVHSFDPCMACAAHVLDADGNPVVEVKVQ